jgi:hypothetical protein
MAQNRILNIFDWKTVTATVSVPDSGFSKIYPQNDGYWYTQDDTKRKRISWYNEFKNGFATTTSTNSVYGLDVTLNIGPGLTFSTDDPNIVYVKGLTALAFGGGNTGSQVPFTDENGNFTFVDFPNINGTLNIIAKFNSGNSLVDSFIQEDSYKLDFNSLSLPTMAALPAPGGYRYSMMGGPVVINDRLYLDDNTNFYIDVPDMDNLNIYTDKNFSVIENTDTYYILRHIDNLVYKTFSVLNGLFDIGSATATGRAGLYAPYLNTFEIGSTDSSTYSTSGSFGIFSSTSKALRIADGTEGLYKFFVSDEIGRGQWISLTSGPGIKVDGITISIGLSGSGLTFSQDDSHLLFLDYSIFDLSSFTYSYNNGSPGPTFGLSPTGVTAGTYGSSTEILQLIVSSDGRISNIVTQSFTASSGGFINSPYDKRWQALYVNTDGYTASNSTMSYTPTLGSYVSVFVNGQEFDVGWGTTNSSCYFGTHSQIPKGFSSSNRIEAGDYLYWNPSIAGFNLESNYRISVHYLYNL